MLLNCWEAIRLAKEIIQNLKIEMEEYFENKLIEKHIGLTKNNIPSYGKKQTNTLANPMFFYDFVLKGILHFDLKFLNHSFQFLGLFL